MRPNLDDVEGVRLALTNHRNFVCFARGLEVGKQWVENLHLVREGREPLDIRCLLQVEGWHDPEEEGLWAAGEVERSASADKREIDGCWCANHSQLVGLGD